MSSSTHTIVCGRDATNKVTHPLAVDTTGQLLVTSSALDDIVISQANIDADLSTINTNIESLVNYGGAGNNNSIGDGTVRLQTYCYGHDATNGKMVSFSVDSSGRQSTILTGNSNASGSGTNYHITCDSGGRMYINADQPPPLGAYVDDGGSTLQSLRTSGNGALKVDVDKTFGSVVTLKDNVSISNVGAYQFNSSAGAVKRGQKITLWVKSESASTSWTLTAGFSFDGTNWVDTISNINAVPAAQQMVEVDIIAPYWRFVFSNTGGAASDWTIKG